MKNPGDKYKTIFEHAGIGILLADDKGIVLDANKIFCDRFGYTLKELVNIIRVDSFVHPDDFKRIDEKYKELAKKKISGDFIHEFRFLKKDGEILDVAATFSFEMGYAIITILNITDKKRISLALKRRDAILEAINNGINQFLKAKSWKDVMPDVLRSLGEASKVARIYCFENSVDEKTGLILMNERFEWAYDKGAAQIENPKMQGLSYKSAGVLRWQKKLEKGGIVFADINSVDEDEKKNMEMLGVKTSVIAPIFINDRWWGFAGLDETRDDRVWSKMEIDTIGVAAGMIGSAIYRQESFEALIAYLTEAALRVKEPGEVIKDNLIQIKKDILEDIVSKESIAAKIEIQVKNIDQVNKNLKELHKAIVENRTEIPEAYRQFISH
ncbi:MAG: PAS domain S-box protein [Methanomicrobium sp.]|nr:PAS domain S-box protein [Methanomicrobium sp.]